jgi:hypothetical protein
VNVSNDEHSTLETCDRPDAWLWQLTLHETVTEPASTIDVSAASTPQESASQARPIAIAVADSVGGSQPSADSVLVDAAARYLRRWFQGKAAARTAFV